MRYFVAPVAVLGLLMPLLAQGQSRSYVRSLGQATVSARPDQVQVQFGVVNQATSAQDAANQNATQTSAVLAALQSALGPGADIKTVGYSLTANYTYPSGGQAVLSGYTASNMVEVTTTQLAQIGRLIDTGIQAGANRVQSLRFSLKDDQPLQVQALRQAGVQAKTHADAMAAGLGLKTGSVISLQEGSAVQVVPYDVRLASGAGATATTPVEAGLVNVTATVTLEIELTP